MVPRQDVTHSERKWDTGFHKRKEESCACWPVQGREGGEIVQEEGEEDRQRGESQPDMDRDGGRQKQ